MPKIAKKECSDCHETKALTEFFKDSKRPDGRYRWCKACNTIRVNVSKARRAGAFVPKVAQEAKPPKVKTAGRNRGGGARSKASARVPASQAGKVYPAAGATSTVETLDDRVTRAQTSRKVPSGVDTSMAEYAAKVADEAKAALAASKADTATEPYGPDDVLPGETTGPLPATKPARKPRTAEQKAADAKGARDRRAAKKAAAEAARTA